MQQAKNAQPSVKQSWSRYLYNGTIYCATAPFKWLWGGVVSGATGVAEWYFQIKKDREELNKQQAALKAAEADFENRVKLEVTHRLDRLRGEITQLRSKISELKLEISASEQQFDNSQKQCSFLESRRNRLNSEVNNLNSQRQTLESETAELRILKNSEARLRRTVDELTEQKSEINTEVVQLKMEKQHLTELVNKLREDELRLQASIDRLKKEGKLGNNYVYNDNRKVEAHFHNGSSSSFTSHSARSSFALLGAASEYPDSHSSKPKAIAIEGLNDGSGISPPHSPKLLTY